MRDDFEDDEDSDLRTTGGKVLQSGIVRGNPPRADYALPPGTPALQDSNWDEEWDETSLEEEEEFASVEEDHDADTGPRVRDRLLLFVAGGAVAAVILVSGIILGWTISRPVPLGSLLSANSPRSVVDADLLRWAGELSNASMEDLWKHRIAFLLVVESQPTVAKDLWKGVERLVFLSCSSPASQDKELARILRAIDAKDAPPSLLHLVFVLQSRLDRSISQK